MRKLRDGCDKSRERVSELLFSPEVLAAAEAVRLEQKDEYQSTRRELLYKQPLFEALLREAAELSRKREGR